MAVEWTCGNSAVHQHGAHFRLSDVHAGDLRLRSEFPDIGAAADFSTWYSTVSPGTTGLRNLALSMVMK